MTDTTTATAAPWGWNPVIDLMDAEHCRNLLSMGWRALATLGWTDIDIRQMKRIAAQAEARRV
jgi:hypothetical protein